MEPPPATPLPSSGLFSTLELSPRHNGRLWAIVHRLPGIPMGPFPAQSGAGWGGIPSDIRVHSTNHSCNCGFGYNDPCEPDLAQQPTAVISL